MLAVAEVVLVLALALGASALSFYSGFGLGTVLLPAFALVFPLEAAIAATAAVHLASSGWKGWLVRASVDWAAVRRFGIPAVVAAAAGAAILLVLPRDPVWAYTLWGVREVTWTGLVVGALIVAFAFLDLVPALHRIQVGREHLVAGGLVSGFFGGLSGHQGALRSMFLAKLGLPATAFIATGAMCAVLVDVTRLAVYGAGYGRGLLELDGGGAALVGAAIAMAALGTILAARWVAKTTVAGLRTLVGALLLVLGPAIAAGLV